VSRLELQALAPQAGVRDDQSPPGLPSEVHAALGVTVPGSALSPAKQPVHAPSQAPAAAVTLNDSATTISALGDPGALVRTGRLLLVLAGGFLLRAATEGGQLAPALGVSLGLAYGLGWLVQARRAHRRGDETAAALHAFAALALTYPLLWEATMRFAVMTPGAAAIALTGVTAALLAAAWGQRLPALAWVVTAATFAAATALGIGTREQAPFAALLVALAGVNLALAQLRSWPLLAWFSAAAADLAVAGITIGALAPGRPLAANATVAVQLCLLLVYLAAAALLGRRGDLGWPLLLQCGVAVGLGWGGAIAVGRATGLAPALGLLGLLLAVAAQTLALAALPGARRARGLFFVVATVFLLSGCALVLPMPALTWAVAGLLACGAGAVAGRTTLALQGAVLAGAAALGSGALAAASRGLLLPPQELGYWHAEALLSAAAVVACLVAATAPPGAGRRHALAVALLLALTTWLLAGLVATAAAAWLAQDPGLFAALGTALLAAGAAALAHCGHGRRLAAGSWLAYPLLGAVALKLLLIDIARGRPFTLFLSFTALGVALLAAAHGRRVAIASARDEVPARSPP
jgi:hypothetical protein